MLQPNCSSQLMKRLSENKIQLTENSQCFRHFSKRFINIVVTRLHIVWDYLQDFLVNCDKQIILL